MPELAQYSTDFTRRREPHLVGPSCLAFEPLSVPSLPDQQIDSQLWGRLIEHLIVSTPISFATTAVGWEMLEGNDANSVSCADLSWLEQIMPSVAADSVPQAELVEIIKSINSLIAAKEYRLLESIMKEIDCEKAAPQVCLAFLRATHSQRQKIRWWRELLGKVADAFKGRGIPDSVLVGLR